MIGGVATQRKRTRVRRGKQLRAYLGTLRAGVLTCRGGALVKTVGEDDRRLNATLRLGANLGDTLIVLGADVAAVRVVEIVNPGWNESWRVEPALPDGKVHVMRGPK